MMEQCWLSILSTLLPGPASPGMHRMLTKTMKESFRKYDLPQIWATLRQLVGCCSFLESSDSWPSQNSMCKINIAIRYTLLSLSPPSLLAYEHLCLTLFTVLSLYSFEICCFLDYGGLINSPFSFPE